MNNDQNLIIHDHCNRLDLLSDGALYILIADYDPNSSFGIKHEDDKKVESKRKGKIRFKIERARLRELICGNNTLSALRKDKTVGKRIDIVSLVADILVTQYGLLPGCALAVLLVRERLETLCNDENL